MPSRAKPSPATAKPATARGVKITHGDRVIDASTGITKAELAAWYDLAADALLPHLGNRPVSLVRAPDGIGGEVFFSKHSEPQRMPLLTQLDPSLDPAHPPLIAIATAAALLQAAQFNTVEFHTWNAKVGRIEQPDRIVFDLDPGEGSTWPALQQGARAVHDLLEELGLASFLKTSGGKGLHVVVPITPRLDWDAVKDFSKAVVDDLADASPDRFVAKSGAANRIGRIFIDYLRNGRGSTTVAAFSARARPGLGVSIPIGWDELEALDSASHWTVRNAAERIGRQPEPWAAYTHTRQGLTQPIKRLAARHAAAAPASAPRKR
ncbi:hypothetical protein BH09PSE6_BH09PSE6_15180 [soil metagenome]